MSVRAMLYVPGNSVAKLAKLAEFREQPIILDLEDSVPHDAKVEARELVTNSISPQMTHSVRINGLDSGLWRDDLDAVVVSGLRSIVVPKLERVESLVELEAVMTRLELERDLPAGSVALIGVIETALGWMRMAELAVTGVRLERLCFGGGDFALDLGLTWPETEPNPTVLAAKAQMVLVSRATGLLPPEDGAYPAYRDHEGLRREALLARRMGFASKHAIHPDQIAVIEQVFSPTDAEIERAKRIVEAFDRAERSGSAAVGVEGELVDYPVVLRARQVLQGVTDE